MPLSHPLAEVSDLLEKAFFILEQEDRPPLDHLSTANGSINAGIGRNDSLAALDADDSDVSLWGPNLEINEDDAAVTVRVDLVGMNPDDIDVRIENGSLVLESQASEDEDLTDEPFAGEMEAYDTATGQPIEEGPDRYDYIVENDETLTTLNTGEPSARFEIPIPANVMDEEIEAEVIENVIQVIFPKHSPEESSEESAI